MRLTIILVAVVTALPLSAMAQDRAETLADIRQELSVLYTEIRGLTRELSTTGGAIGGVQLPASALDRVNKIESELQRLTARTEELQYRVDRIVSDGTTRIGDLEFRLCELEEGCDIGSLGEAPTLGGGALPDGPAAALPDGSDDSPELAMGEQADFDRAAAALEAGDFEAASRGFGNFTQSYPAGPLTPRAHLLNGDALVALGQTKPAATAYLEAFSAEPEADTAAQALRKLGESLARLGQTNEACVTLGEVAVRFPDSADAAAASQARAGLGCP